MLFMQQFVSILEMNLNRVIADQVFNEKFIFYNYRIAAEIKFLIHLLLQIAYLINLVVIVSLTFSANH